MLVMPGQDNILLTAGWLFWDAMVLAGAYLGGVALCGVFLDIYRRQRAWARAPGAALRHSRVVGVGPIRSRSNVWRRPVTVA